MELLLALGTRLVAGVLFLIAGIVSHHILSNRKLPILVSIGPIIYGLWGIISAVANTFILYQMMHGDHQYLARIAFYNSILSFIGNGVLVVFAVLFIVGISKLAERCKKV